MEHTFDKFRENVFNLSTTTPETNTANQTLKKAVDWMVAKTGTVAPCQSPKFHKLIDAMRCGKMIRTNGTSEATRLGPPMLDAHEAFKVEGIFLVRHNWGGAFGEIASKVGWDFKLPFNHCVFESRVADRNIIIYVTQPDGEQAKLFTFAEFDGEWVHFEFDDASTFEECGPLEHAWVQVRAIAVALDCGIATYKMTAPSIKLNKKRVRDGKAPINSYSVVDLAKAHVYNRADGEKRPYAGIMKLHFRRGHWRQCENDKAWVKWTLVGNPDLGFIDHHYTL